MPFFKMQNKLTYQLPDAVPIQPINDSLFIQKKISLSILRLDLIDPVISGNKLFKLKNYLEKALVLNQQVITFGGAYSNHLVACAHACKKWGIKCTGIVRGEEPKTISHSLQNCLQDEMVLKYISRHEYDTSEALIIINNHLPQTENYVIIPEGGFGPDGAKGAEKIAELYDNEFSHVCLACGTATTFGGILNSGKPHITLGFNVTKDDIGKRLLTLKVRSKNYQILNDFNFGGYARKTEELINFMNAFYTTNKIPTDFVYTGKMMYGILNLIKNDFFKPGCKILAIHSGGLQGNLSLPQGTLLF
ncbi:MAG: pyridoxal-phosphate dependent enzyme [Ginsengibacter sp.]